MGRPQQLAMTVASLDIRVVILLVRHEPHGIDEAQRVVKVGKLEVFDDGRTVGLQLPAWQLPQVA